MARDADDRRPYAKVYRDIWSDEDFTQLPAMAQRLFFVLLSQPDLAWTGVLPYLPTRWAHFASDTTVEDVMKALAVLGEANFLVIDERSGEVLIRTFVRNDEVYRQPNLVKAMWKAYRSIHSQMIREAFLSELPAQCYRPTCKPPIDIIPPQFLPAEAVVAAAVEGPQPELPLGEPTPRTTRDNSGSRQRDNSVPPPTRDNSAPVGVIASGIAALTRDNSETPGQNPSRNPSGNPSEKGCRTTTPTPTPAPTPLSPAPPAAEAAPPRTRVHSNEDSEEAMPGTQKHNPNQVALQLIVTDDQPKPPGRERPRDPVWDAVCAELGLTGKLDAATAKRVGRLVHKVIRATADDDATDEDLAAQVRERAARYRRWWPRINLTVEALAKHWVALASDKAGPQTGAHSNRTIGDFTGVKSGRISLDPDPQSDDDDPWAGMKSGRIAL